MFVLVILNTPGAYIKLRLPLIVLVTSFGFVPWPPGHRRMFSFGIAKGRKGARGIKWSMRLAPLMVHTRGASMWHGHFIGRKTLTERQKEYNDVHGFYRARIENVFARMWHWGIARNIWRGSGSKLHEYVCVLLHLQQFLIRRQVRYPPYGPWEHVPAHVWTAPTQEDNDDEDVVGDDGDVCALCCTKSNPEKMSMCDKCELQYCTDCIGTHTHVTM